jgi:hypothetical protein
MTDDRLKEQRRLEDDLFSKVDYIINYLENEPPPASDNVVEVAALLISHAEWMRQRLARTQQEQGDAIEDAKKAKDQ